MSVRVMSWVFEHSRSKKNARLVLLAIADCANDEGRQAYPSMPTLMKKTGLSERAVTGLVGDLERLGELEVKRNGGPRGCNLYRVVMTPAESAPPQNLHPAGSAGVGKKKPQAARGNPAESAPPANPAPPQETTVDPAESAPGTVLEPSEISSTKRSSTSRKRRKTQITDRPDVERVCAHLADRMVANDCKRPTITQEWRDEARRLIDLDGRTEDQIMRCIDWATAHHFWRKNILSMPTLRKQYDRLRLDAEAERRQPGRSSQLTEVNGLMLGERNLEAVERAERIRKLQAAIDARESTDQTLSIEGRAA